MSPANLLLLWAGAIAALALSIWLFRRTGFSLRGQRLVIVLVASLCLLGLASSVALEGWLVAVPQFLFLLAISVIGLAYNLQVAQIQRNWVMRQFEKNPELRERFERNPFTSRIMKFMNWWQ